MNVHLYRLGPGHVALCDACARRHGLTPTGGLGIPDPCDACHQQTPAAATRTMPDAQYGETTIGQLVMMLRKELV